MAFLTPFLIFLFSGCAKLGYLTEQGVGQMKLQWNGVENEKLLNDPKVSDEHKRKIRLISEYKRFFYHYFELKEESIYSKTTMLKGEAVTYLLIAAPHTELKAHEFSFPFVGSFPYIGFFHEDSAKDYAKRLEKNENLVTWIRPVYAYSTLGYFEDRILSSFFEFDDVELAELIFHELFHTIFFAKDEVELNENLAQFVSHNLLKIYFKDKPELAEFWRQEEKKEQLSQEMVKMIHLLQDEFKKLGPGLSSERADELTSRYTQEVFVPRIKQLCLDWKLEGNDCKIRPGWNQAIYAALLTYEEEQGLLKDLEAKNKLTPKEFYHWIQTQYKSYKKSQEESFLEYLKKNGI